LLTSSSASDLGPRGTRSFHSVRKKLRGRYDVSSQEMFRKRGLNFPQKKLTLIALKNEMRLEVWAKHEGKNVFVKSYRIHAASGREGPKLKQGDYQVPEGFYQITMWNPNSRFHLSMRVNYPNTYDRLRAKAEKRTNLGGDIFIHGSNVSAGCLAMGDQAIEELYYITSLAERVNMMILPFDFREKEPDLRLYPNLWVNRLYGKLWKEVSQFTYP